MAKPITATAPISGQDAKKIEAEMRHGTPATVERTKLFTEASRVFSSLQNSPFSVGRPATQR